MFTTSPFFMSAVSKVSSYATCANWTQALYIIILLNNTMIRDFCKLSGKLSILLMCQLLRKIKAQVYKILVTFLSKNGLVRPKFVIA